MIIVDASVVVDALVSSHSLGDRCRDRLASATQLNAPHLIDIEVTHALRRLVGRGLLDEGVASHALGQLGELPINRFPHEPFLGRIWQLRHQMTAYDAAYVAVAEAADAPLLTLDGRLAGAHGVACDIEVVAAP